ncbi:MAG: DUF2330 domain-containing protein [Armatimonadota bacterium]
MRICAVALIAIVTSLPLCLADGGFVGPRLSERAEGHVGVSSDAQKGIVIHLDDQAELLMLQTTYRGPAADFGWIIPVPGLPGSGNIFPASKEFMDYAFQATAVATSTRIDVQRPAGPAVFAGAGQGAATEAGTVIVHRRMQVGDYDAAVLSGTTLDALTAWLERNGFALPTDAQAAVAPYVAQRWYFVALRVRPEVARARPVLSDAPPIAIRFRSERLVYPLAISPISAPPRTALSLIVIADAPLGPEQLPWAPVAAGLHPPGSSWATVRRAALGRPTCAVCERVVRLRVPDDPYLLAEGRWTAHAEASERVATRLWALLPPEQMMDLTFSGADAPDRWPEVVRRAAIRDVLARSPWAVLLAGLVALMAVIIGAGRRPIDPSALWAAALGGVALTVFGVSGWALVPLVPAALILSHGAAQARRTAGQPLDAAPLTRSLSVVVAVVLLVLALPLGLVAQGRATYAWEGVPLGLVVAGGLLLAALILVSARAMRDAAERQPAQAVTVQVTALPALPARSLALFAAVGAGWAAVLIAAGSATPAPALLPGDGELARAYWALASRTGPAALVFGAELAWIGGVIAMLALELRQWRGEHADQLGRLTMGMGFLYALGAVLITPLPGIFGNLDMLGSATDWLGMFLHVVALGAGIALLCFTAVAPWATPRSLALAQGLTVVAVFIGLLTIAGHLRVLAPAQAGSWSREAQEVADLLDERLREIDAALAGFAQDTGCYPARLEDLTGRTPPERGLDASGNPAALAGNYAGPYLALLPVDPLTGRRDTWVYEVTGSPMVDSGGYSVTVVGAREVRDALRPIDWQRWRERQRDAAR